MGMAEDPWTRWRIDINARLTDLLKQVTDIQIRVTEAERRLTAIEASSRSTDTRLSHVDKRLTGIDSRLAQANTELSALQSKIEHDLRDADQRFARHLADIRAQTDEQIKGLTTSVLLVLAVFAFFVAIIVGLGVAELTR